MRRLTFSGFLALVSLPLALHAAEPAAPCQQARPVPPQSLMGIPGTYDLSNGDILHVSKDVRRYFAETDRIGRVEIVPLSEHLFAEKNGPLRFEFNRDWPAFDVIVRGFEQPRSAGPACRG